MTDQTNYWRSLEYHDPAQILRRLRVLELELANVDLDPKVRRLRTSSFKKYREWRDAAVFTYGMGKATGRSIGYATEESADYDFVTAWRVNDEAFFCPVQLKEWVPTNLNPDTTLEALLDELRKYAPTSTVVAVKLNRAGRVDLSSMTIPRLRFAQLWFFWAAAPDARQWCLYGDALVMPTQFQFEYPT